MLNNKVQFLDRLLEDILDANIVQLDNKEMSFQVKTNPHGLFFVIFSEKKTTKKALRFKEISTIQQTDIGQWKIDLFNKEQLLLQCYTLKKSGIPLLFKEKVVF